MRFRAEPVLHGKVDTAKKSVVYKRFYHLFVEGELEVNPDKPRTQNLPNDSFAEGELEVNPDKPRTQNLPNDSFVEGDLGVNHGSLSPLPVTI